MNAKRKLLRYLSTINGLLVTSGGDQSTKSLDGSVSGLLDFQAPEENLSRYIRAEVIDKSNIPETLPSIDLVDWSPPEVTRSPFIVLKYLKSFLLAFI